MASHGLCVAVALYNGRVVATDTTGKGLGEGGRAVDADA